MSNSDGNGRHTSEITSDERAVAALGVVWSQVNPVSAASTIVRSIGPLTRAAVHELTGAGDRHRIDQEVSSLADATATGIRGDVNNVVNGYRALKGKESADIFQDG